MENLENENLKNLDKFLRKFKTLENNPFNNPFFEVSSAESFSDGVSIHKINDIKLIFNDEKVRIKFKKKNWVLGSFLFCFIIWDKFGFDPDLIAFLNKKQKLKKFKTSLENFKEIEELVKDLDREFLIEIEINFSKTKFGKNAYNYHKQNIIFIIDENAEDLERFEKIYDSWSQGYKTSEDI